MPVQWHCFKVPRWAMFWSCLKKCNAQTMPDVARSFKLHEASNCNEPSHGEPCTLLGEVCFCARKAHNQLCCCSHVTFVHVVVSWILFMVQRCRPGWRSMSAQRNSKRMDTRHANIERQSMNSLWMDAKLWSVLSSTNQKT